MITGQEILSSLLHLFYPHTCPGCGTDLLSRDAIVCSRCLAELPATHFEGIINNPVEKRFWGRLELQRASAAFFFTKHSAIQNLMHELKYKGNKELGLLLGRLIGIRLINAPGYKVTALVPLPLHPARERVRGYNQATLLCEGMSEVMKIPVIPDAVIRTRQTETQTKKGRIERWQNMEGRFSVQDPAVLSNQHVCLVDDVITTGATLEACGSAMLEAAAVRLSIACLCYASRI